MCLPGTPLVRSLLLTLAASSFAPRAGAASPMPVDVDRMWTIAGQRTLNLAAEAGALPANTFVDYRDATSPTWTTRAGVWWTSGFLPGTLWQLYERTGDATYRTQAERFTMALAGLAPGDAVPDPFTATLGPRGHDVGFVFNVSAARGFALTGDERYRRLLLRAAQQLDALYDPAEGATRSWTPWGTRKYPVIIDNLISIQALHAAAEFGGPASYDEHAHQHVLTSRDWHVRADGSSFHVIDLGYDPPMQFTFQGYAPASTWARGQAWGVYGFAESYAQTGDARLLTTAQAMADYWMNRADAATDAVPMWDLNLPATGPASLYVRDSSAAAVMAVGLIKLSGEVEEASLQRKYFQEAERILQRLSSDAYLAPDSAGETRLLLHSVAAWGQNVGRDSSQLYADYYFLEALTAYETAFPGPGIRPGDANRDGRVDEADLAIMKQTYRTPANWLGGDFDRDGHVDFDDLLLLAANYERPGAMNLSAVLAPEPTALAVGCIAMLALTGRVRRSGKARSTQDI